MKLKNILFFVLAVIISYVGATYRWGDSAHSIGLIKANGGKARHPSVLESSSGQRTLIATATVIPPYRGDARVVLEGEPKVDYKLYFSEPIIDLGLHRHPRFKDGVMYGLRPKDRIALWVVMDLPPVDPVCGMAREDSFTKYIYEGKDFFFCSDACRNCFIRNPKMYKDKDRAEGKYTLAFYDTKTDRSVLNVPIIFKSKGEGKDAGEHQH